MSDIGNPSGLNPQQTHAVQFGLEAPLAPPPALVIAGAGSGKTRTIAHRVAALCAQGVDPARILLLTFSRRAAREMARRAADVLSDAWPKGDPSPLPWCGTFHAIGARLVRQYASALGLPPDFAIQDREDSADLMNLVRHDLGLATGDERFPAKATCLAIHSACVNSGRSLEDVLKADFAWALPWEAALRALFAAYGETKRVQAVLDYDDILLNLARALDDPVLAADMRALFDHVLVDEYQDTNRLQASILLKLKPDGCGLFVVGDDAQAIYSFRSADVRNILEFPSHFSPPAAVITLERNYRSTEPVLAAANQVIALGRRRYPKALWTDRMGGDKPKLVSTRDEIDAAQYVVTTILRTRECGVALRDQAVLFRAAHHSAALEVELRRAKIPFEKWGGLKFLEAAHVKDLLAFLRVLANGHDKVSALRVLLLMPGVGPVGAQAILRDVDPQVDHICWEWAAVASLRAQAQAASAPEAINMARAWLEPKLASRYADFVQRRADLDVLAAIASTYGSLQHFLSELAIDPVDVARPKADPQRLDEDALVLSTIHSAKGQEWRSVYLLNVTEGALPSARSGASDASIEEERRLLYVAMTRARDELHLIAPGIDAGARRGQWAGRLRLTARSRFLPDHLLSVFEQVAWPGAPGLQELPPSSVEAWAGASRAASV